MTRAHLRPLEAAPRPGPHIAVLVGAVGVVSVIGILMTPAAAPPSRTSDLANVFGATNAEFPEPAFLVNGEPVSGAALARSVAVFEYQGRQLGHPIDHRSAVKFDHADTRGYTSPGPCGDDELALPIESAPRGPRGARRGSPVRRRTRTQEPKEVTLIGRSPSG